MSGGCTVGIVGCGLIGAKRAAALYADTLLACADPDVKRAASVLGRCGDGEAFKDAEAVIQHPDIEVVIIATPNHLLAPLTAMAIDAGKHVLVEKPGACRAAELEPLVSQADQKGVRVRVGFNHRYHPAFRVARTLLDENALGPLMFVRARYGHGGRIGYDREWRANPALSGGGELIDQGVHLIDLSRWILGDLTLHSGFAGTYFWDMPVDDNAFMMLKGAEQRMAFLHASCTEWKNMFSMEIYGRVGKLHIEGLGGSYGVERITHYKMLPKMGPPDTMIQEFPRGDDSWEMEWTEFKEDIRCRRTPSAGLMDAIAALKLVEEIYAQQA